MHKDQVIQSIKEYDTIIIHRHVRPDPDALGSQAGLRALIKETFPHKQVYIVGEEDPSLTFLVKMDEISDEQYNGALVIVCDTANTERISDQRYHLGDKLIKIDHHPNHDPYGDIHWVDTTKSSTSEMIYELFLAGKNHNFVLSDEGARLIYAGIVGDTGRFLFPNTSKRTFQYAAELVEYDFDRTLLYEEMYKTKENIARLQGYILQHYTLDESGVSTIKITKELLQTYGVKPIESSQLVRVLGNIEGIRAWALFIEEEDLIRVRLRSKGPVINGIAQKYNGGGHPLASGATVYTWEEADQLTEDLKKLCLQA